MSDETYETYEELEELRSLAERLTNAYVALVRRETNLRPLIAVVHLHIVRVMRQLTPILRTPFSERTPAEDLRLSELITELRALRVDRTALLGQMMAACLSFSESVLTDAVRQEIETEEFLEELEAAERAEEDIAPVFEEVEDEFERLLYQ